MKLSTYKCHLIVPVYRHEQVWENIGKELTSESNDVKLLGITIDRDLKFDKHALKLCSKANQKLSVFSRTIRKSILSRLFERALRIVYDDDVATFDQLLAMGKSVFIHHQNIQRLLIEIYKALNDISGNSLKELFVRRKSTISVWSKPELVIPSVNSIFKGKNFSRYLGSVIWNYYQLTLEKIILFCHFLTKIKQ